MQTRKTITTEKETRNSFGTRRKKYRLSALGLYQEVIIMLLVKNQLFQMIEETAMAAVLYVGGVYLLASLLFRVF